MFKSIIKALFSLTLMFASAFAGKLEVVSLLEPGYDAVTTSQDFCKLALQESLRYHLKTVANEKGAPEWVKQTNEKFKTSVYNAIPSEIVRCILNINPCGNSAKYGDFAIMEFLGKDGYVGLESYTGANWNYFLLMNCLNMMINYGYRVSDDGIEDVKNHILHAKSNSFSCKFDYSQKKNDLDVAAEDIKIYMSRLRLYAYINELKGTIDKLVKQKKEDLGDYAPKKILPSNDPVLFAGYSPYISDANFTEWNGGKFTVGSGYARTDFTIDCAGKVQKTDKNAKYTMPSTSKLDEYISTSNSFISGAPCGLQNMGATCYFDATMQFLYASDDFKNFVVSHSSKSAMAQVLDTLFTEMTNVEDFDGKKGFDGKICVLRPAKTFADIADILSSKKLTLTGETMKVGTQHDASELLGHLLDVINDRLKEDLSYKKAMEKYTQANSEEKQGLEYPLTDLEKLCYYKQTTKLQGNACKHASESSVLGSLLGLGIPCGVNACDLQKLVSEELSKKENLDGDNKWLCEKCNKRVDAKKVTLIEDLPQTLIVHLKRFAGRWQVPAGTQPLTADEEGKVQSCRNAEGEFLRNYIVRAEEIVIVTRDTSKIKTPVAYNQEMIINGTKYRLRATIHHSGGCDGGHYWDKAFTPGGIYYEANDSSVTKLTSTVPTEDDKKTVYLLMYERVK